MGETPSPPSAAPPPPLEGDAKARTPADNAKEIFGGWQQPKPYIRIVPQPQ